MTYQHVFFPIPNDSGWVDTKSDPMGLLKSEKHLAGRKSEEEKGLMRKEQLPVIELVRKAHQCIAATIVTLITMSEEQGAESSNSQGIDIGFNPNNGNLDGDRDHGSKDANQIWSPAVFKSSCLYLDFSFCATYG
ncbi:hypothetical protein ACH5RR_000437 [Cinchona calisaya]|uniref:Uncharacterized protein n=1 Tax=Cinchona calisaya TaxID=153742 RepID=A0ABD3B0W7_9GENT